MEGVVTKAVNGFFTVQSGEQVRVCRARGVFRKRGVTVLCGDRVKVEPIGTAEGVITEVFPRSTELIRPPIANVDQALLVFAVVQPDFQPGLLDRLLVSVTVAGLRPVIVVTKCDLATEDEVSRLVDPYLRAEYPVIRASVETGVGIDGVARELSGHITVFAGPSGVGKSSLANAILPDLRLAMGEVSDKLGRGRHTTRHVELFPYGEGGYIADAPGFSQLDVQIQSTDLRFYFPEFNVWRQACDYRGCLHATEDGCAVRAAVADGCIVQGRYDSYLNLLAELQTREENQY